MGATIAYCRVSSRDQNPGLQLNALDAHGYDRLFAETESGNAHEFEPVAVPHAVALIDRHPPAALRLTGAS